MQLGTRWAFGDEPPRSVPEGTRTAVRAAEAELAVDGTALGHWTLTWLEGRAIAELDDGTRVTETGMTRPGDPCDTSDTDW